MDDEVVKIAGDIEREEKEARNSDLVTLTNGIVLKTKTVPYKLITRLDRKYKLPPVPIIEDEERGRKIPNPNDPAYELECKQVQEEKGMAMLELLTGLGTELVSVPAGIYRPEDSEWVDEISPFLDEGETIVESGKARYVAWLIYYAMIEAVDITKVSSKIKDKMGVSTEGVGEAINRFPDNEGRGADPRG